MVSLLHTKFHEILFISFRGVALTNCVTDRRKIDKLRRDIDVIVAEIEGDAT
jgi:hypothetical protein